jgi:hypothetical protein
MYHFVLGGLVGMLFFRAVQLLWRGVTADHLWGFVLAIALLILTWYERAFPLGVQDRVIRLEMRLRLERLLAPEQFARFDRLTIPQVVALRFAGDAELPALVAEVLDGKLVRPEDIKQRVKDWQADWARI